jgi:2-oxoisovalerate dehydrogenase E1 component
LLVAHVVRLLPHSSSDDHAKYRTKEEIERDRALDPIPRMTRYLIEQGVLTQSDGEALRK